MCVCARVRVCVRSRVRLGQRAAQRAQGGVRVQRTPMPYNPNCPRNSTHCIVMFSRILYEPPVENTHTTVQGILRVTRTRWYPRALPSLWHALLQVFPRVFPRSRPLFLVNAPDRQKNANFHVKTIYISVTKSGYQSTSVTPGFPMRLHANLGNAK